MVLGRASEVGALVAGDPVALPPAGESPSAGPPPFGPPPGRFGKRPDLKGLFQKWDKDKDGKLSRDEAPEFIRDQFAQIDTDKDGFISREEDQAFLRQRGPGREGLLGQDREVRSPANIGLGHADDRGASGGLHELAWHLAGCTGAAWRLRQTGMGWLCPIPIRRSRPA